MTTPWNSYDKYECRKCICTQKQYSTRKRDPDIKHHCKDFLKLEVAILADAVPPKFAQIEQFSKPKLGQRWVIPGT